MAGAPVQVKLNPQNFVNFSPYGTVALTVTGGGTASISGSFTSDLSVRANSYLVYNATTQPVFVTAGYSGNAPITAAPPTATESNNSTPVGPGAILLFTKLGTTTPNALSTGAYDTVAVYPGSASGSVYFTAGDGA